jgi:hypothetical protein
VENKPISNILTDIINENSDILRVRVEGLDTADGTIFLNSGIDLVQSVKNLIISAACSTHEPRPVYSNRKFKIATEFSDKVRLGQTERGSFVVTAHTPIQFDQLSLTDEVEPPFERKVTETLYNAINIAKKATISSREDGSLKSFEKGVEGGLSANLCESIIGMARADAGTRISFDMNFSPNLPTRISSPETVDFDLENVNMLEKAAAHYREVAPVNDFQLEGFVEVLKRKQESDIGKIEIICSNPEEVKGRRVKIGLENEDYKLAVDAHNRRLLASCEGELISEGKFLSLKDYKDFQIIEIVKDTPTKISKGNT